jgi:hypothetical protein
LRQPRIIIFDVDGNERDFSARRAIFDHRYTRQALPGDYRISDARGSYFVNAKELKRCEDAELAELMEPAPEYEPELRSGRDGGYEINSIPDVCRDENFQRVLGGAREASERIFGWDDDFFGTRR